MTSPYVGLPPRQFWKKEPGIQNPALLDPIKPPAARLTKSDRIVTAGSCFAQHVARYLTNAGYNHYVSEQAHPVVPRPVATAHNYGLFSARYGNVYTARQLNQLLKRAFGSFEPIETSWTNGDVVVDPFRPQIQPGGYVSAAELEVDRKRHLACVRDAIEKMDVFVFTLGLTEAWRDKRDGAVYPLAPGVAGGDFDPARYEFVNFNETETFDDLKVALDFIRSVNPSVRIILTVSPVPLNATYEDRHVLLSTTWSKAVLRICAEKAMSRFERCEYFPSYEIITSPHARGAYFGPDCRDVTQEGVEHVMRLFLKHYGEAGAEVAALPQPAAQAPLEDEHSHKMKSIMQVLCDEEMIDNQ